MRLVRLAVATAGSALLSASLVALAGSPAQADSVGGGTNGSGYTVAVDVAVSSPSGDGNFAGSVSSVSVPPVCWWETWDVSNLSYYDIDPNDPERMEKYFKENYRDLGSFKPASLAHPSLAYLESHRGNQWTWYELESAPGTNCADEGFTQDGGTPPPGWENPGSGVTPVAWAAFQGAPPPPIVDPEDLALAVWDEVSQDIEGPDLDRNPKATADGVAGATLVNMETWFWVQNVQAALAGDGLIELDISVPGTPVEASLTATTDGMQVSSPAGAATCTIDQAQTEYAAGVAESSACSFPFSQANTAGWEVTASTTWTASWEGTQNDGTQVGGDLETLTPSATSNVPVAESQAIVDEVG